MKINMAHLREKSTSGGWINFAIFEAKPRTGSNSDNGNLLFDLTNNARSSGLKVDQSALAYRKNGRIEFYGSKNLVAYLSRLGVPRWTHQINV
ncbi:MAG: hypothetical protein PF690_16735 [Deltaproteobacteria bacterium]|jgi:hypothetical protein|nr:hypothetical protein [Deltaproteobacteria bacterium]